jgi:hypothetical protein
MKPETLKSKGKAPKAPEKKDEKKGEEKGDDKNLSKKDKFKALLEKWKTKKGKK